jgi:hypothetical protein
MDLQPGYWLKLETFEDVAAKGMKGWLDDDDSAAGADFILAQLERTHALNPKVYRVPKKWRKIWWKLAKERYGNVPYSFNQGLGLYDRWGRKLRVYPSPDGDVIVRISDRYEWKDGSWQLLPKGTARRRRTTPPFLCLFPLASILLLRRENITSLWSYRKSPWGQPIIFERGYQKVPTNYWHLMECDPECHTPVHTLNAHWIMTARGWAKLGRRVLDLTHHREMELAE